ncbi:MAG: hypothetical protein ACP5OG_03500 [Candidatus Nanoarchaeia archaeon]
MKKIKNILIIGMLLISSAFSLYLVSAEAYPWPAYNVCCEKTKSGAWCQNTLKENCDTNFLSAPTSCESTSYCKPGCCYDSQEGLCMENTPQKVCGQSNGTWDGSSNTCDIPQCSLGCCVIGNQASFVTLTRCKRLSSLYGLETDFRKNILDEVTCIATASTGDRGACVYESEYQRTCRLLSRGECTKIQGSEFYKDYLCTAEELATNCGPTEKTMCVDGKDEVYFMDSCGNPANIYDAGKIKEKSYWKNIIDKSEACGYGANNANAGSKTCGNCDFFGGSICQKGSANYGEYSCKDLNCYDVSNGNDYKNGESWCSYDGKTGNGLDSVGSRQYRHVCMYGEELIEACADFRNEVCYEGKVTDTDFREAACRVNRWKDCVDQIEEEDCLNTDKRDCYWVPGISLLVQTGSTSNANSNLQGQTFQGGNSATFSGGTTTRAISPITGNSIFGGDDDEEEESDGGVILGGAGVCLPNVPAGFKFWDSSSSSMCSIGNSKCVVKYEKGLIGGGEECVENCECLEAGYVQKVNQVCTSLGDCGAYVNWVGKFTDDGAEYKLKGEKNTKIVEGLMAGIKARAGVKYSG